MNFSTTISKHSTKREHALSSKDTSGTYNCYIYATVWYEWYVLCPQRWQKCLLNVSHLRTQGRTFTNPNMFLIYKILDCIWDHYAISYTNKSLFKSGASFSCVNCVDLPVIIDHLKTRMLWKLYCSRPTIELRLKFQVPLI